MPITQSLQQSLPNLAYTENLRELFKNKFLILILRSTATETLGLELKKLQVQNAAQVILKVTSSQVHNCDPWRVTAVSD